MFVFLCYLQGLHVRHWQWLQPFCFPAILSPTQVLNTDTYPPLSPSSEEGLPSNSSLTCKFNHLGYAPPSALEKSLLLPSLKPPPESFSRIHLLHFLQFTFAFQLNSLKCPLGFSTFFWVQLQSQTLTVTQHSSLNIEPHAFLEIIIKLLNFKID